MIGATRFLDVVALIELPRMSSPLTVKVETPETAALKEHALTNV